MNSPSASHTCRRRELVAAGTVADVVVVVVVMVEMAVVVAAAVVAAELAWALLAWAPLALTGVGVALLAAAGLFGVGGAANGPGAMVARDREPQQPAMTSNSFNKLKLPSPSWLCRGRLKAVFSTRSHTPLISPQKPHPSHQPGASSWTGGGVVGAAAAAVVVVVALVLVEVLVVLVAVGVFAGTISH